MGPLSKLLSPPMIDAPANSCPIIVVTIIIDRPFTQTMYSRGHKYRNAIILPANY